MKVTVKLTVRKDRAYTRTPHFRFQNPRTGSSTQANDPEEFYCVTGIESDLREATRAAARNMIEFLGAEHSLDRVEAYMLCSVAADLRMLEVVSNLNALIKKKTNSGRPVVCSNNPNSSPSLLFRLRLTCRTIL